jgi:hypothetical protein
MVIFHRIIKHKGRVLKSSAFMLFEIKSYYPILLLNKLYGPLKTIVTYDLKDVHARLKIRRAYA